MTLNFSKSENVLGMYVIQFCKITVIAKLIKTELTHAEEKATRIYCKVAGGFSPSVL